MPITNNPSTLIQAETLQLLEWPRLCQHLATFAATKLGIAAAVELDVDLVGTLERMAQEAAVAAEAAAGRLAGQEG